MWIKWFFLCLAFVLKPVDLAEEDCPTKLPLKVDGRCYRLETGFRKFRDARDNCAHLEAGAAMAIFKQNEIPQGLVKAFTRYVQSKTGNGYFWIGLKMEDRGVLKAVEEREWTFDFDEKIIIQKDYQFWTEHPEDGGLTCSVINGSRDFNVQAVDCGGPRIPVICMKRGECQHDFKPYLMYGKYCLASINGALEYNKIHGACHPDFPTPLQDEDMKNNVVLAAKNSFFGGAVFVDARRFGDKFIYLADGSDIPADLWEAGEPSDKYDCVGLSLQTDGSLKLRAFSCDFLGSSLCTIVGP